ncbi:hypothetical protein [Streptomyces sp. NPDC001388]|uniref:hypothetical protein n=1 Tax=Streptomyces sp. NPDC001388 TaxID=3364568 RepID=UPI00368F7845
MHDALRHTVRTPQLQPSVRGPRGSLLAALDVHPRVAMQKLLYFAAVMAKAPVGNPDRGFELQWT